MPSARDLPVRITADLRVEADPGAALSPAEALSFAQRVTEAAVFHQAALLPARRRRRLFSDNLALSSLRMVR